MRFANVVNLSHPFPTPLKAGYCSNFWCRFKGLMLRNALPTEEGLLFVLEKESVVNSSIHMMFMNFDIAVVWLDSHMTVVDVCHAKRWKPMYKSAAPAKYILELAVERLQDFNKDDQISINFI